MQAPIRDEEIDDAPVGKGGDDQVGDALQLGLDVERAGQDLARLGEESDVVFTADAFDEVLAAVSSSGVLTGSSGRGVVRDEGTLCVRPFVPHASGGGLRVSWSRHGIPPGMTTSCAGKKCSGEHIANETVHARLRRIRHDGTKPPYETSWIRQAHFLLNIGANTDASQELNLLDRASAGGVLWHDRRTLLPRR